MSKPIRNFGKTLSLPRAARTPLAFVIIGFCAETQVALGQQPSSSNTPTIATMTLAPGQARPAAQPPLNPPQSQTNADCGPKDKASIAELLQRWSSAYANRNAVRAISIFAEDGVLSPLATKQPVNGRADLRAYYTRELKAHQALALTGISARIDCQQATVVGSYGVLAARLIPTSTSTAQPRTAEGAEPSAIDPRLTPNRFRMRLVAQNGEWLVSELVLLGSDLDAEHKAKMRYANALKAKRPSPDSDASAPGGSAEPTFTWASLVSMQ